VFAAQMPACDIIMHPRSYFKPEFALSVSPQEGQLNFYCGSRKRAKRVKTGRREIFY
jgi:hypothetical protein